MPAPDVTFLVPSLNGGGAERAIVNLASALSNNGFNIELVVLTASNQYRSEVDQKVDVVNFNQRRVIYAFPALLKYIFQRKPLHLFSIMPHLNILTYIACRLVCSPAKCIASERNFERPRVASIKDRLIFSFRKIIYPKFHLIAAVSQGVKDDLVATNIAKEGKIFVLPNIINSKFERLIDSENWNTVGRNVRLIAIGRLEKQKDYETLLKAIEILDSRESGKYQLDILGEGGQRQKLTHLISRLNLSSCVRLRGFQDNPEDFLSSSDVFVMSSIHEGLPNAIIQALRVGLPVVSTDCNFGPAEILDHGKFGWLCPVGDADSLASAIQLAALNGPPKGSYERSLFYTEGRVTKIFERHVFSSL